MAAVRDFEIVLLGATGYTGKLCAEHIAKSLPTDLKWGIAGRSTQKLEALATELQALNSDRRPPVKACAVNGTHYMDVTGEFKWIKSMVDQFHETAKSSGAILISGGGMESAPADLLTWAMANSIKEDFNILTSEVIMTLYELKAPGFSGGTLASVLENFGGAEYRHSDPYELSINRPAAIKSTPIYQKIIGAHYVSDIGVVTTAIAASCDEPIVHRTSSLMPQIFHQNFRFREYMKTRNLFTGIFTHIFIIIGALSISLAPVRWLLRHYVTTPGQGPPDESRGSRVEYRGIAKAEHPDPARNDVKVLGSYRYEGGPYTMTGVLLAEAGMVLARSKRVTREIKGGYVTPAALEQEYIDRLEKVGIHFQVKLLKD
ncbi:hypothetical protein FQN57_001301 [Myotisia sp. PD_48]|nr:hypothetical protein FQN57_001301 [Myotisia sp. PD_48]